MHQERKGLYVFFPVVHKPFKEYELVFNVYNLENRLFLINGFYTSVPLSSHGFSLFVKILI